MLYDALAMTINYYYPKKERVSHGPETKEVHKQRKGREIWIKLKERKKWKKPEERSYIAIGIRNRDCCWYSFIWWRRRRRCTHQFTYTNKHLWVYMQQIASMVQPIWWILHVYTYSNINMQVKVETVSAQFTRKLKKKSSYTHTHTKYIWLYKFHVLNCIDSII